MLHIPPTKILISQPLKKPTKKQEPHQRALPFGKWRLREKEVRRMGRKQNRISRQKEQQDETEEQKRRYRKLETESPEIRSRQGEDIRNPRPPFGGFRKRTDNLASSRPVWPVCRVEVCSRRQFRAILKALETDCTWG